MLASCISTLAGGTGATQAAVDDDDELRKIFVSLLRQGASDIFLDNVIGTLDGAAINHLVTAPIYQGRILGVSETISVPNNAILILTGNNIKIQKDLMRRVLICRLDTGLEKPYTKNYAFCPLGLIRFHRMKFVRHALIILRGSLSQSRPIPKSNFGSFEDWDYLVRRSILLVCELINLNPNYQHIELADPIENMINAVDNYDPDSVNIDLIFRGLNLTYGDKSVSPREIYQTPITYLMGKATPGQQLLRDALEAIDDFFGGKLTSRRLGYWLLYRKDRVIGAYKLVCAKDTQTGGYLWRAMPINTGSTGTTGTF